MKTKSLTAIVFTGLIILVSSCVTPFKLKVASDKNSQNAPNLGIQWNYSYVVNNSKENRAYRQKIDSAINAVINTFNRERHSFTVHKENVGDKDYIVIDNINVKIASKGAKLAGYIISGVGILVVPAAVAIASKETATLAFWDFPRNFINSNISLSPDMSDPKSYASPLYAQNGALFSATGPAVNRLISGFFSNLYDMLLKIDKQLSSHMIIRK